MSGVWREEDDEEYKVGGRGGSRSKPRFSFTEIKLLLEEVKRNRYIILKKFNHGVSAETKKQTWAEITEQINDLGENRREVRQIMKKWADLKCDGKRRMAALRGPNGSNLRKKNLGPVERMVHKILLMSPGTDIDSDLDFGEDDEEMAKCRRKVPPPTAFSYLNMTDTSSLPLPGGASFDLSPLSSPEKDLSGDPFHSSPDFEFDMAEDGDRTMDFDDDDMFSYRPSLPPPSSSVPLDPLPDDALLRNKPVHTYSRNNSNTNHHPTHSQTLPRPASSSSVFPSTADSDAASSSVNAPQSPCNTITNTNGSPSSLIAPSSSSSSSLAPPRPTSPLPSPSSSTPNPPHPEPSLSSISLPPPPLLPPVPPFSSTATSSLIAPAPASDSSSSFITPPPPPPPPLPGFPSSSSISHNRSLHSSSSASSSLLLPLNRPSASGPGSSDPLPAGASSGRAQDHVAHLASQSLQQQQASRVLLASVSQSLETLAQSVQLLVESQQEFVQESLMLQRETVDVLRDFSNTALTMLREKSSSSHVVTQASHF